MLDSKFIQVYRTLDRLELRQLKKWINSPIHNNHESVTKLFAFLSSRYNLSDITLNKKRVFEQLFPKQNYDEDQLNHIISYSYKTLLEFLGYIRLIEDQKKIKKSQFEELKARQLPKIAQQVLQQRQKQLKKQSLRNATYHLHSFEIEEAQMQLKTLSDRNAANNLPAIFKHLSDFFVITTLRYACIAISHTQVHKTAYTIPFLSTILTEIDQLLPKVDAVVQIYYRAYMALKNPTEQSHFAELKVIFFENAQSLDQQEQRDILLMAINYCIRRLNEGQMLQTAAEALELYEYGLDKKILLEQGLLSKFAFNNIVSLGLKLKRFDWVQHFIERYGKQLNPKFKISHVHYNTAKWHFAQQQYQEVLLLLIQMEYDDILINVDAKVMLVKIYYLQGSFDALDALLNSFTVFLQRKSMLSYHKANYSNFIQLTKRLLHIAPYDTAAKKSLEQNIQATQPLSEQKWLLSQLNKR